MDEKVTIFFQDGTQVEAECTQYNYENIIVVHARYSKDERRVVEEWTCSGCSNDPCCCSEQLCGPDFYQGGCFP